MPRGGRRPGAGAKPGNVNALKSGNYSVKWQAFQDAIDILPGFGPLIREYTAGDPRRAEHFGYILRFMGDMLLRIARGESAVDLRGITDRAALTHVLKRWKPPPMKEDRP